MQLATDLGRLYQKGNLDERMLLCETVFKRIRVKQGRITRVELNAPFTLIASFAQGSGTVTPGGAGGIRTPYLLNAIQSLSQLSYSPTGAYLI